MSFSKKKLLIIETTFLHLFSFETPIFNEFYKLLKYKYIIITNDKSINNNHYVSKNTINFFTSTTITYYCLLIFILLIFILLFYTFLLLSL
jgi:hypothetical protein